MASEKLGLVQTQRELNLHQQAQPQLVFPDSFTRGGPTPQRHPTAVGDPGPKTTRELTGFINHNHNYFHQASDFRRSIFSGDPRSSHPQSGHNWNSGSRVSATPSGEGSEDDDENDDDDDDDDDDNEVQGLLTADNKINEKVNNNNNSSNNSENTGTQKIKHSSSFGFKEGNVVGQSGNSDMRNSVTIAEVEGGMYYGQYLKGTEGLNEGGQKDMMMVENGVGFSGRKEGSYSNESGESLRAILADPITGALMDNAMILPCGHSFGSDGIQHVLRMKACYSCSHAISEVSVAPNLSLRAAVQAFRREEELHVSRASKRRRERYDQEKGIYGDSSPSDLPRGRGVQFPFAVSDRVLIKGNKRTPQRFVGREAIVTTQCLNGWYVVKTLDNAESVKVQYRSLAKVPGNQSSKSMPTPMPTAGVTPNWL